MSMKNPMTPAGIEPATFRFPAQHLNHCATAVPGRDMYNLLLFITTVLYVINYTYLYHHTVVLDTYTHSNLVYYETQRG